MTTLFIYLLRFPFSLARSSPPTSCFLLFHRPNIAEFLPAYFTHVFTIVTVLLSACLVPVGSNETVPDKELSGEAVMKRVAVDSDGDEGFAEFEDGAKEKRTEPG